MSLECIELCKVWLNEPHWEANRNKYEALNLVYKICVSDFIFCNNISCLIAAIRVKNYDLNDWLTLIKKLLNKFLYGFVQYKIVALRLEKQLLFSWR